MKINQRLADVGLGWVVLVLRFLYTSVVGCCVVALVFGLMYLLGRIVAGPKETTLQTSMVGFLVLFAIAVAGSILYGAGSFTTTVYKHYCSNKINTKFPDVADWVGNLKEYRRKDILVEIITKKGMAPTLLGICTDLDWIVLKVLAAGRKGKAANAKG